MWRGSIWNKLNVIFNFLMIFLAKAVNTAGPLLLKAVIDAMTCVPAKDKDGKVTKECPDAQQVYVLIGVYAAFKLLYDLLNNLREIPYAYMAAAAEISIAHDVYDHV